MTEGIYYFNNNVLRALSNWPLLQNATMISQGLEIGANGAAGCDLNNEYFYGGKASLYRSVHIVMKVGSGIANNFQNNIDVVVHGTYDTGNNEQPRSIYASANITPWDVGDNLNVDTWLEFQLDNFDFEECAVMVVNHTDTSILVTKCEMFRSMDVSESQIGQSIGWGVTLDRVEGYANGCRVYYENVEQPDEFRWVTDLNGKFAGVRVNGDYMIGFSRFTDDLPDE